MDIQVIAGEELLKKPKKWSCVTVLIDGVKYYLSAEEVNLKLFVEELVKKGVKREDIEKLLELHYDLVRKEINEELAGEDL